MTDPHEEAMLTLDEAVQFLGTSRPTLYRLLSQGDIKGLKVGRQWRFRRPDLVAYMERSPLAIAAAPPQALDAELAFFAEQLGKAGKPMQEMDSNWPANMGDSERGPVRLAYAISRLALTLRASDIHLEPAHLDGETISLLRLRLDGVLHEVRRLAFSVHEALVMGFKIMADLPLSERRVPQDGRIPVRYEDKDFDFRVSTIPVLYGEAITMRILDRSSANLIFGLDKIDLADDEQAQVRGWMGRPNGLILFTGPVGSGKTTTAISAVHDRAGQEIKTLTLEDPIELALPYMTQVQINPKAGLTHAAGLRAFMRQDPDVVYLSDLPGLEAAQLAVQTALTGHLVLSTLPTSDTASTLTHLMDMGLAPHLLSATVIGVTAQRLVRRLCEHCKEPYRVAARDLLRFGLEPDDLEQTVTLHRGAGCEQCRQRGYRGRTAIYEIMEMTEDIRDLIVRRAPPSEITTAAQSAGMNTLAQAGLLKVLDGATTPEEVLRVIFTAG